VKLTSLLIRTLLLLLLLLKLEERIVDYLEVSIARFDEVLRWTAVHSVLPSRTQLFESLLARANIGSIGKIGNL